MADESPKSLKSLLMTLGPALISALIAVAALIQGYYLTTRSQELSNHQAESARQIALTSAAAELRTKIIEARKNGDYDTLARLIKHSLKLVDTTGTYEAFSNEMLDKSAEDAVASDPKGNEKQFEVITNYEKPLSLNKDDLVRELTGPERLLVSNRLIELYKQNKRQVVDALIDAILPESDKNSYRNNLYIAFTLGRVSGGWEGTANHARALEQLKNPKGNYGDQTFRKWVNTASEKRIDSP